MWRDSMGFYSISAGGTYDMGRTDDNKKSIGKNADLERQVCPPFWPTFYISFSLLSQSEEITTQRFCKQQMIITEEQLKYAKRLIRAKG